MPPIPHLSTRQLLIAFAYSAVFPITNLIGGGISLLGIIITYPFLPLAWGGGTLTVSAFGSESAYLFGAFVTVVLQVLLCMLVWSALISRESQSEQT